MSHCIRAPSRLAELALLDDPTRAAAAASGGGGSAATVATIDAGDYDLRTALHLAASEGNLDAVAFLVDEAGADPSPIDRWGGTPLDDARRTAHAPESPSGRRPSPHVKVARYLEGKGARAGKTGGRPPPLRGGASPRDAASSPSESSHHRAAAAAAVDDADLAGGRRSDSGGAAAAAAAGGEGSDGAPGATAAAWAEAHAASLKDARIAQLEAALADKDAALAALQAEVTQLRALLPAGGGMRRVRSSSRDLVSTAEAAEE